LVSFAWKHSSALDTQTCESVWGPGSSKKVCSERRLFWKQFFTEKCVLGNVQLPLILDVTSSRRSANDLRSYSVNVPWKLRKDNAHKLRVWTIHPKAFMFHENVKPWWRLAVWNTCSTNRPCGSRQKAQDSLNLLWFQTKGTKFIKSLQCLKLRGVSKCFVTKRIIQVILKVSTGWIT
jgi:hypothetical protein